MKNLAVCILSNGSPYLDKLWKQIRDTEPSLGWLEVMNNKSIETLGVSCSLKEADPHTHVLPYIDKSIYQMWNIFRRKHEYYNGYMAFLNDDIEILPGTLEMLIAALETDISLAITYPDQNTQSLTMLPVAPTITYTETTAGAGGMTGYCFMMRGGLGIPHIDENLTLYWGDDDLVKQTLAKGYKIGRVDGLPIQHVGSYTINKMNPDLRYSTMEKDRQYFNAKYGENRSPVI